MATLLSYNSDSIIGRVYYTILLCQHTPNQISISDDLSYAMNARWQYPSDPQYPARLLSRSRRPVATMFTAERGVRGVEHREGVVYLLSVALSYLQCLFSDASHWRNLTSEWEALETKLHDVKGIKLFVFCW